MVPSSAKRQKPEVAAGDIFFRKTANSDRLLDTAMAEALQAIVDLDLDTLASTDPPRGYGRN